MKKILSLLLATWREEPDTFYVITTEVKDGVLTVMEDNAYYYNRK